MPETRCPVPSHFLLAVTQVLFAGAYLALAAMGLRLAGSFGLVLANCLNMAGRIAYAWAFLRRCADAVGAGAGAAGAGAAGAGAVDTLSANPSTANVNVVFIFGVLFAF